MRERPWFRARYAPGTAARTVPFTVGRTGDLDENAPAEALTRPAIRHESPRTILVTTADGDPAAIIADQPVMEFRVITDSDAR